MEYYSCDGGDCEAVSTEPFAILCVDPATLPDEKQKEWATTTGEWSYYEMHFCMDCIGRMLTECTDNESFKPAGSLTGSRDHGY